MSIREQKRRTADREVRMPRVFLRWPASSSRAQLARSSPCSAGPSRTQRRTSSSRAFGLLAVAPWPLGPQPVPPALAEGVEPAADATAVEAQVLSDVLAGPPALGHQDDLHAVPAFAALG